MCDLLTAADIPTSTNAFSAGNINDDAVSKTTHTLNTRESLLKFDANTVKSSKLSVDVKMDALVAGLDSLADEPMCEVCDGVDERVCLAGLEVSLGSLTDSQRLIVLARTMGAYPSYASCDSTDGDKSCLKKLDKVYRSLSTTHRLSILTDACTLGSYATAAASLAAVSTSSQVVTNVKQAMNEWADSTDPATHSLISKAASSAADFLAVRGGVASLQGGRAAKLMHTLTSWTTTVSTLAADVVPVVTETKDTTATSRMTAVAANYASGVASGVRSLVSSLATQSTTDASGSSSQSEQGAKSGESFNIASQIGESALGFILGAVGAAGLVYAVITLRKSFAKNRGYNKIPEEGRNKKKNEAPAFVLSL